MKFIMSLCAVFLSISAYSQFEMARKYVEQIEHDIPYLTGCCPDSALQLAIKGIKICEEYNLKRPVVNLWILRGNLYMYQSNFEEANQCYFRAYTISRKYGFKRGIAGAHLSFGNAAVEPSERIDHYRQALSYFLHHRDTTGIVKCYNNIGAVYLDSNLNLDSAEYYFRSALMFFPDKSSEVTGELLLNMGGVHFERGNIVRAGELCREAMEVFEKIENPRNLGIAINRLAQVYFVSGKMDSSMIIANRSNTIARAQNLLRLQIENYTVIGSVFQNNSDWLQAFKTERILDSLHLLSERQMGKNALNLKMIEYKNAQNEQKINGLIREQELQATIRNTIILTFIGALLLLTYILFLHRSRAKLKLKYASEKLSNMKNKRKLLEKEMAYRRKELIKFTSRIIRYNDILQQVSAFVRDIRSGKNVNISEKSATIYALLTQTLNDPDNRNVVLKESLGINAHILSYLAVRFPSLTRNDLEILSMIMTGLSIKESAVIMNIEASSVATNRYRLRKKLGLCKNDTFDDFLSEIREIVPSYKESQEE